MSSPPSSTNCNRRPLAMDTHPSDGVIPLTPGHFLTGGPLAALPGETDIPLWTTYGKHWRLLQRMTMDLWRCCKQEYLLLLQRHKKWKTPSENLHTRDLVLLKDTDLFQRSWHMGVIVETYPGTDRLVRAVDIRVYGKVFCQPVHKMVKFLGEDHRTPLGGSMFRPKIIPEHL